MGLILCQLAVFCSAKQFISSCTVRPEKREKKSLWFGALQKARQTINKKFSLKSIWGALQNSAPQMLNPTRKAN